VSFLFSFKNFVPITSKNRVRVRVSSRVRVRVRVQGSSSEPAIGGTISRSLDGSVASELGNRQNY